MRKVLLNTERAAVRTLSVVTEPRSALSVEFMVIGRLVHDDTKTSTIVADTQAADNTLYAFETYATNTFSFIPSFIFTSKM